MIENYLTLVHYAHSCTFVVNEVPDNLQLELIHLQSNKELSDQFNTVPMLESYASLFKLEEFC